MIASVIRKNLLAVAMAYSKAADMSLSDVSRKFYGRGVWLRDFKAGKTSISIDKLEDVIRAFRRSWPQDTPFPVLDPIFMDRKGK